MCNSAGPLSKNFTLKTLDDEKNALLVVSDKLDTPAGQLVELGIEAFHQLVRLNPFEVAARLFLLIPVAVLLRYHKLADAFVLDEVGSLSRVLGVERGH